MIVHIEVQIKEAEDAKGWRHPEPTGLYSVMRSDGSKRDVNTAQLIALLQSQPSAIGSGDCPVCGAEGISVHENDDGTNHICPNGCQPFRFIADESI